MKIDPLQQNNIVNELWEQYKDRGLIKGDKYYVLDYKWYINWSLYAKVLFLFYFLGINKRKTIND